MACSSSPPCSRSAARGSCGKKCGRAGLAWIGAGIIALGLLAAYGGIFVAGSLAWGIAIDGFRPDRYDIVGALTCLLGVAVITYAPRG